MAVAAVMREYAQLGGEAGELGLPVAEHRHRTHDERWPVRGLGQNRGDELSGLAEAHVVGQTRAEIEATQEREPSHAPLLVGA